MSEDLILGVRIVSIDNAMCRPMDHLDFCLSPYSGNAVWRVPVIRIFGILKGAGSGDMKCCLHIHRVFPYLLVRFHPTARYLYDSMTSDEVNLYLASFGQQIESIMASLNGDSKHRNELFYNLSIVFYRDFYGYHHLKEAFIKITVINPLDIGRIAQIVRSGVINDTVYEPFECHIPYLLHFLKDHNLYGMNFVFFKAPSFRQPVASNLSIPIHLRSSKVVQRDSICALEMDIVDDHILNSQWIRSVDINSFDADLGHHRLVPSLREIWNGEKLADWTLTDSL